MNNHKITVSLSLFLLAVPVCLRVDACICVPLRVCVRMGAARIPSLLPIYVAAAAAVLSNLNLAICCRAG